MTQTSASGRKLTRVQSQTHQSAPIPWGWGVVSWGQLGSPSSEWRRRSPQTRVPRDGRFPDASGAHFSGPAWGQDGSVCLPHRWPPRAGTEMAQSVMAATPPGGTGTQRLYLGPPPATRLSSPSRCLSGPSPVRAAPGLGLGLGLGQMRSLALRSLSQVWAVFTDSPSSDERLQRTVRSLSSGSVCGRSATCRMVTRVR